MMDFRGKRVTLVGLGTRTHVALAHFLVRHGAEVTISDAKPAAQLGEELRLLGELPVRLRLGGHQDEDLLGADVIFVTPGAPRELPGLLRAAERGIALSSEIELLFALCRAPIIGITGSSGKTTTTTMVGEICKASGRTTLVGGNIGLPLIDHVDEIPAGALVVLELSSFQLEYLGRSPHVGAILNITPNHLDRHGTLERYAAAKWNIVAHQAAGDYAVLGVDDPETRRLAARCAGQVVPFSRRERLESGACLDGDRLVLRRQGGEQVVCRRGDLRLRGEHNVSNALAACAVGAAAGMPLAALRQVLTSFTGVEHRLELVRERHGVRFYNDSIATSPERAVAALRSFEEPIVLIVGGRSKHLPLEEMASLIAAKARAVVLVGEMAEEIEEALERLASPEGPARRRAATLEEAVAVAADLARPGDVVLLSPGGTSFDMFRDFEARGRRFKEIVGEL